MAAALDFGRFEVLSFDCFGTLIDFERGVLTALRPILDRHGVALSDDELLETYGALKLPVERSSPFLPFREVLLRTIDSIGCRFRFEPTPAERSALGDSIGDWPPFPDTVEALARLRARFFMVVTSRQVGSYKPSLANFHYMLERLGGPKERVLHVAQSLFHDISPAREVGLTSVWINRRHDRPGFGGTPPGQAEPDLRVPDLRTLADLVEEQRGATADR